MEVQVAIAGAGPTGLMLACELALVGVRPVVLERSAERLPFCRAFNLNARSLELLDRRGILDRFLAEGWKVPRASFGGLDAPLDLSHLDADQPYTLGIPQTRTEALLEARAAELGVSIAWGCAVGDLDQDETGITVGYLKDGSRHELRAAYLVGCDGGRSTVRKLAGIPFPGTPSTEWALLGDVELVEPAQLDFGVHRTPRGTVFVIPRPGYVRLCVQDPNPPAERDVPVQLAELEAAVGAVLGREIRLANPRWLTRFGNAARQAERYRQGRVLLAGDAAHIHPPAGAQGLNVGIQDAFNLGWKLAAVARGEATEALLDTYHAERHPAGERILMNTRAQLVLSDPSPRVDPMRQLFSELASLPAVQRYLAGMVTGTETRYEMGAVDPHPLLGRLAPDLELEHAGSMVRLAELLHAGRGVVLELSGADLQQEVPGNLNGRVECIRAACNAYPEVQALLVRPDGYVAWLTLRERDEQPGPLRASLDKWFL